ncbi:MAG TPA: hypothetical protein DCG57_17540 [Candidatus Riflebacteria bacterium]|nr:hypothetical protein [Candidatus Riflebacteria bacterium]
MASLHNYLSQSFIDVFKGRIVNSLLILITEFCKNKIDTQTSRLISFSAATGAYSFNLDNNEDLSCVHIFFNIFEKGVTGSRNYSYTQKHHKSCNS